MKKLVIVYFRGLHSTGPSGKVMALREAFPDADIREVPAYTNVRVGLYQIQQFIDHLMIDYFNDDNVQFVFVGTSFGGWYANEMSIIYGVPCILINPLYDFKFTKGKVSDENYDVNFVYGLHYGFKFRDCPDVDHIISLDDEVIDFRYAVDNGLIGSNALLYLNTNHRFDGPEFEIVIDLIRKKYA